MCPARIADTIGWCIGACSSYSVPLAHRIFQTNSVSSQRSLGAVMTAIIRVIACGTPSFSTEYRASAASHPRTWHTDLTLICLIIQYSTLARLGLRRRCLGARFRSAIRAVAMLLARARTVLPLCRRSFYSAATGLQHHEGASKRGRSPRGHPARAHSRRTLFGTPVLYSDSLVFEVGSRTCGDTIGIHRPSFIPVSGDRREGLHCLSSCASMHGTQRVAATVRACLLTALV